MKNRTVDARGLACPLPVVNAKKAVEEMKEGSLTVLVDNEIAVQNLQKFAHQKGYQAAGQKITEKEYQVIIRISSGGSSDDMLEKGSEETVCSPDLRKNGMVVVLSANVMGTGDEELGKALMKGFVFAVTKQDILPETILCYNTGAYLTCEGSDALEDLKNLEAEGVRILTCGTCLEFYGIKDKLAAGSVTNMYEIVEIMEQAGSVIRP